MAIPSVRIGDVEVSRLMVGGNPFSGNPHRPGGLREEMLDYYSTARIHATLRDCEAVGITTLVARSDAHITRLLRDYWNDGGSITWIAQTSPELASVEGDIQRVVANGAQAVYLHGGWIDTRIEHDRWDEIERALDQITACGVPRGIAAHHPEFHLAAAARVELDFHLVCCYRCGSLHAGKGDAFDPADLPDALDALGRLARPCIAYKVLGAGRFDPAEQFPLVVAAMKPTDSLLVGFWTKYHRTQVEDTAALFEQVLSAATVRA